MSSASTIPLARPTVVPPGDIIFFILISYVTNLTFCNTSPVNFTVPTPKALPFPGCLGLDAMWQLVGFYLGWLGGPGRGRALGSGQVKFTGQVLPTSKKVTYNISLSRVIARKLYMGIADATMEVDGKTIYEATNLRVGLFTDTSAF